MEIVIVIFMFVVVSLFIYDMFSTANIIKKQNFRIEDLELDIERLKAKVNILEKVETLLDGNNTRISECHAKVETLQYDVKDLKENLKSVSNFLGCDNMSDSTDAFKLDKNAVDLNPTATSINPNKAISDVAEVIVKKAPRKKKWKKT